MKVQDLESEWLNVRRDAQARWGKLTDDDLDLIHGNPDQLVQRLQERYGLPRQIVLAEVGHFLAHAR